MTYSETMDSMIQQGFIVQYGDRLEITPQGRKHLAELKRNLLAAELRQRMAENN